MRCATVLWRQLATTNRLGLILICLFMLNGCMVVILNHHFQVTCSRKDDGPRKVRRSVDLRKNREYALLDATNEFHWRREVGALADTLPMFESNSSFPDESGTPIPKSNTVAPIKIRTISLEQIRPILLRNYSQSDVDMAADDVTKAYNERVILNCANINYLERRKSNPRIVYNYRTATLHKGEMRLQDGQMVTVAKKISIRQLSTEEGTEEDHKLVQDMFNLWKLLKMQGWRGIPRLYAACISTKDGTDATLDGQSQVQSIRYITDRYDDAFKLCEFNFVTDDCIKLARLRAYVKSLPQPQLAALRIMTSFAETFENLWLNGIFPYKFHPNQIVITKDFKVMITTVEPLIYLDPQPHGNDYKRLLSDASCKCGFNCPTPGWQNHQILIRFGSHCKEVRGHCGSNSRCWGLDASAYVCTVSKWVFHQLSITIPLSWKYTRDLQKLQACAGHVLPEQRCNWTTVRHRLDNLLRLTFLESDDTK